MGSSRELGPLEQHLAVHAVNLGRAVGPGFRVHVAVTKLDSGTVAFVGSGGMEGTIADLEKVLVELKKRLPS